MPEMFLCFVTFHLATSLLYVFLSEAEGERNKLSEAMLLSTTVFARLSLRTGHECLARMMWEYLYCEYCMLSAPQLETKAAWLW